MKIRTILIASILIIFSSCKHKKIEIDQCQNGFLDAGETKIDCGGICAACKEDKTPYLFLNLNGKEISFQPKKINLINSNYYLVVENDTINFNINLGPKLNFGTKIIPILNTNGQMNLIAYPNASNGIYTVNKIDSINKTVSGFFDVKLSKQNPDDTLFITGGQFSYLSY